MIGGGLDWSVEDLDGARVAAPSGRVDESNAAQFTDQLIETATGGGLLVLDLGNVTYMSSRGLRALTLASRCATEAGGTIVLAQPSETMREILAISRYDQVFRVTDTVAEALAG